MYRGLRSDLYTMQSYTLYLTPNVCAYVYIYTYIRWRVVLSPEAARTDTGARDKILPGRGTLVYYRLYKVYEIYVISL